MAFSAGAREQLARAIPAMLNPAARRKSRRSTECSELSSASFQYFFGSPPVGNVTSVPFLLTVADRTIDRRVDLPATDAVPCRFAVAVAAPAHSEVALLAA